MGKILSFNHIHSQPSKSIENTETIIIIILIIVVNSYSEKSCVMKNSEIVCYCPFTSIMGLQ